MSDPATATSNPGTTNPGLRTMALLGYGLLGAAPFYGLTAIVGVVIAYIKRAEARGTPYESHFSNIIVVFWSAIVIGVVFITAAAGSAMTIVFSHEKHMTAPLIALACGLLGGGLAFAVWYFFRVIKGFIRAMDGVAYV